MWRWPAFRFWHGRSSDRTLNHLACSVGRGRRGHVARNVATMVHATSVSEVQIVPLTQDETRAIFAAALERPNAARWSIGLALGLRQGEALGLRWQYVNLDNGVARVWWQLQRTTWLHGCADPHACGARLHKVPCPKACARHRHREGCAANCRNARHVRYPKPCPEKCTRHRHRPDCASDCAAPSHQGCPKPCLPDCQRHRHRQPCPPDCAKPEHRGCLSRAAYGWPRAIPSPLAQEGGAAADGASALGT